MDQSVAMSQFWSPINLDRSSGMPPLSDRTRSTMELWLYKDNHGEIEWCVDELDIVEHIGLVIEIAPGGQRTVVDYDGVFSLPDQAMDLLEACGVNCVQMRADMAA